jgi:hypothetical protein
MKYRRVSCQLRFRSGELCTISYTTYLISPSATRKIINVMIGDEVPQKMYSNFTAPPCSSVFVYSCNYTAIYGGDVRGYFEMSMVLRRAELGEHFNGTLYFSRYLRKRGIYVYCLDIDAYFYENHLFKNRQPEM